jgi:hypothetical protein
MASRIKVKQVAQAIKGPWNGLRDKGNALQPVNLMDMFSGNSKSEAMGFSQPTAKQSKEMHDVGANIWKAGAHLK